MVSVPQVAVVVILVPLSLFRRGGLRFYCSRFRCEGGVLLNVKCCSLARWPSNSFNLVFKKVLIETGLEWMLKGVFSQLRLVSIRCFLLHGQCCWYADGFGTYVSGMTSPIRRHPFPFHRSS